MLLLFAQATARLAEKGTPTEPDTWHVLAGAAKVAVGDIAATSAISSHTAPIAFKKTLGLISSRPLIHHNA
jgi:hypothetical protein